jgi:hypothetical protein
VSASHLVAPTIASECCLDRGRVVRHAITFCAESADRDELRDVEGLVLRVRASEYAALAVEQAAILVRRGYRGLYKLALPTRPCALSRQRGYPARSRRRTVVDVSLRPARDVHVPRRPVEHDRAICDADSGRHVREVDVVQHERAVQGAIARHRRTDSDGRVCDDRVDDALAAGRLRALASAHAR